MPKLMKNIVLPLLVLAIAGLIAIAMVNSRADLPRKERDTVIPTVASVIVEPGPVPVTIHSRGVVSPRWHIDLVSEVAGRVDWVAPEFLQGGEVAEGQLLLRIDPIDYEVAVSDARAAVASAELALAEVQVVVKKAAIAEAQARLEAARARLRHAENDLANTEIRAPFDAVVDLKLVDLGQYVQKGAPIMTLLSTGMAEVRLPVVAADVPYVRFGEDKAGNWQQVTLTASFGSVDYSWQARLARLERRVDAETRVFFLVAEIDHPYDLSKQPRALAMGLFVEATFKGDSIDNAVRLPRSAVHGSSHVYVVRQGKIYRQGVELVRREQDSVIVRGLASGARVVLSRLDLMVDGMAVALED
jgi:RND family efflux transporter MFP subunit